MSCLSPGVRGRVACAALLCLVACASVPKPAPAPPAPCTCGTAPAPPAEHPQLRPVAWSELPGWAEDQHAEGLRAFLRGCPALRGAPWKAFCGAARAEEGATPERLRAFLEAQLVPHAVINADGTRTGLITGYYEPVLTGSLTPSARFRFPLLGVPPDLLVLDLASVYPEVKGLRLRGRLDGARVVPYPDRAQIEAGGTQAPALIWLEDRLDGFILEIQGSGKVRLDSGEVLRLAYAEQNGHPYRAIGRVLVSRGELTVDKATLPGIRLWANQHPEALDELLRQNPSKVFFTRAPADGGGPRGSLGVELTPLRSLAVDPRVITLGAPVFLAGDGPPGSPALNRLMAAQDTGGAIRGGVRADVFFGTGDLAAAQAGVQRGRGRLFVLLPRGIPEELAN